jgi:hypothetical protein
MRKIVQTEDIAKHCVEKIEMEILVDVENTIFSRYTGISTQIFSMP